MLEHLLTFAESLIGSYDIFGLLVGMFISSSILPVPSEAILVYAGVVRISIWKIAIFGGLGSSLGSIIGYYLGKSGNNFFKNYGKYIFINPTSIVLVEKWFKRFGDYATLVARIVPFIPYKIFSISCGFGRMKFKNFFIFTLIGSIPRAFLLSYFGYLISLTKNLFLIATSIGIFFVLPILIGKVLKR